MSKSFLFSWSFHTILEANETLNEYEKVYSSPLMVVHYADEVCSFLLCRFLKVHLMACDVDEANVSGHYQDQKAVFFCRPRK